MLVLVNNKDWITFNMAIKKEPTRSFSVNFPISLVEEIDQICSAHYTTRTSWLLRAAKEMLLKERVSRTEDLISKLTKEEDVG